MSNASVRSVKDVRNEAMGYFADWIQIMDNLNTHTLDEFPYNGGVPDKVENHCWKCVTVNKCWFVNQDGKKPEEMAYDSSLSEIPLEKQGIYHPHCHCKKISIGNPQVFDISLINLTRKIEFMWKDKIGLYEQWGYSDDEKDTFIEMVLQKTKESYVAGNYEIEAHTRNGVKINCIFTIPDKNPKYGGDIEMWSNWMIFPNGTLKCNTVIGGWTR